MLGPWLLCIRQWLHMPLPQLAGASCISEFDARGFNMNFSIEFPSYSRLAITGVVYLCGFWIVDNWWRMQCSISCTDAINVTLDLLWLCSSCSTSSLLPTRKRLSTIAIYTQSSHYQSHFRTAHWPFDRNYVLRVLSDILEEVADNGDVCYSILLHPSAAFNAIVQRRRLSLFPQHGHVTRCTTGRYWKLNTSNSARRRWWTSRTWRWRSQGGGESNRRCSDFRTNKYAPRSLQVWVGPNTMPSCYAVYVLLIVTMTVQRDIILMPLYTVCQNFNEPIEVGCM